MAEEFISEPIKPKTAAFDTAAMAIGAPGVPQEFSWRKENYKVKKVLRTWKKARPCTHGSGEKYIHQHYYEILTDTGERMTIYFDRQPAKGKFKTPRWWLFTCDNQDNQSGSK